MGNLYKRTLPWTLINSLRELRGYVDFALLPVDYLSRAINGKTEFPPLHLRRCVGPLRTFEFSGAEFLCYLRLLASMRPDEQILDLGCGCGLMALYLKSYLNSIGGYVGVDIHQPSIAWCKRQISPLNPNFHFTHIDLRNLAYNPRGKYDAENYAFPYENGSFNVILLKSVFTHMRPPEVDNYLREVSRLLRSEGRCLATFFLLNQTQESLAAEGRNEMKFAYGEGAWRYLYAHSPENAVAYEEKYIIGLLQKHGLVLQAPIYYGTWSGRDDGLSFQDILILEKG